MNKTGRHDTKQRAKVLLTYSDIEVVLDHDVLILGNSKIRRILDCASVAPRTISLADGDGEEFASLNKAEADLSFIGLNRPADGRGEWEIMTIAAARQKAGLFDGEAVKVTMKMRENIGRTCYRREYFLYPELPVIAVRNFLNTAVMPNVYWTRRGDLFGFGKSPEELESCADSLRLHRDVAPDRVVLFRGRTDYTDEPAVVLRAKTGKLNGNLLFCRERRSGRGIFFLQEAPPSGERRDFESHDFRLAEDGAVFSCNWGIFPAEIRCGREFPGYRHVLGLFHSETESQWALKEYLKRRFPSDRKKHASVMVNPRGCGKFPELVSTEFLKRDIAAAAAVGATHYQIDDGWQAGGGIGELSFKNRKITPDFWTVSPRLGGSFDGIAAACRRYKIEPALWLAPSFNCEYEDWKSFADLIIEFHRRYGFRLFKLDGIKLRTCRAEQNLRQMLQKVRTATGGEAAFNLDTTNGQRPGYFHFLEFGSLFLENRCVCCTSGLGYHPEKALHTLWRLTRFMNPYLLQIEIVDPAQINPEFYRDYRYGRPDAYPLDYLAMLSMFASPLLWFTPSTMAADDRKCLKKIMTLHKKHREAIASGITFPIGREPDGKALSGFHSRDFRKGNGYLLLFREKGHDSGTETLSADHLPRRAEFRKLAGCGSVKIAPHGGITAAIRDKPGYVMFQYVAA